MPRTSRKPYLDIAVIGAVAMVVSIGVLAVSTSSYPHSAAYDNGEFMYKQLRWAAIGLGGFLLAMRLDYRRFNSDRAMWSCIIIGMVLLLLCFAPGIGVADGAGAGNAQRWIGWKSIRFQPSEAAKVLMVLAMARWLTRPGSDIRDLQGWFAPAIGCIALAAVLIEREPDLGTATVFGLGAVTMLYVGGAKPKHIRNLVIAAVLLFAVATASSPYRRERIYAWLDPVKYRLSKSYQVFWSVASVSAHGPRGAGFANGTGKYFLPAFNSDYIYATVCEEGGLWASWLVVALLGGLSVRAFRIAGRSDDPYGQLVAAGIGSIVGWQSFLNMGVATNLIPPTGIPLPFVSYGGSSLVVTMSAVGLLLSVARHPARDR